MIEFLKNVDTQLFLYLNSLHNPVFDTIMYLISGKLIWVPLYAFIIYLIIRKYGKISWVYLIGSALLILMSDQLSVLVKETFERLRPCHCLDIKDIVHKVNGKCGGMFGFVSSHASNSFAVALYATLLLRIKSLTISLFIWATIVSYSRIYLGVHYPLDVIGGAIIGMFSAISIYFIIKYLKRKYYTA